MSISHSLLCRIASTLHYMMMWSVFFLHLLTSFYYFHSKFFIEVASCIPGSAVWAAGSWKFSPFEACDRKFQSLIRNIKFKKQEAVENRIANIVCTYIYLHVCICVSKTMNINCYKLLERERQASTAWQYSIFPAERKVHTRHTRFRWVWWVWHVLEVDVFFSLLTIHVQILIHWRLFKFVSYHWMLLNVIDSNWLSCNNDNEESVISSHSPRVPVVWGKFHGDSFFACLGRPDNAQACRYGQEPQEPQAEPLWDMGMSVYVQVCTCWLCQRKFSWETSESRSFTTTTTTTSHHHHISPHLTTSHQNITPHQRITAHILWANSFLGLLVLSPLKLPPQACAALLVRL